MCFHIGSLAWYEPEFNCNWLLLNWIIYKIVALDRPMAVIQLSGWCYGLKHLEITQKKTKQLIFVRVVMSRVFLLKKL